MHLLKESTKPVPTGKKRRKIAALELLPVNPSVLIPNVGQDPPEEEKGEQEHQEQRMGHGSKRNKTKPQPFMQ